MLANLSNPWLLARLLASLASAALGLYAVVVAVRVMRAVPGGARGVAVLERSGEGVLAVERRAELVAALVQVGLFVTLGNLALLVLAGDRLSSSIRGAMCAYGVFGSSDWGLRALGASVVAALACAAWLALHRFDLGLERPLLLRTKLVALLFVVPFVVLDAAAFAAFALDLDFQVVASCCSVALDDAAAGYAAMQSAPLREGAAMAAAVGISLAAALALLARRGAGFSYAAAGLGVVAAAAALPAILWFVAPHAYETPHHLCPFCLFRPEAAGLGFPLFGAVLVGLACALSLAVVELGSRRARGLAGAAPAELDATLARARRRIGAYAAVGWASALFFGLIPVVRYALATGGASLFG